MSSVFNVGFRENLSRILSEERPLSRTSDGGKDFSKVLGDIERERANPSNARELPAEPTRTSTEKATDSKAENAEVEYLTSAEPPLFRFVSYEPSVPECALNECQLDGATTLPDVNASAAIGSLRLEDEEFAEIPEAPVIRSAERVKMSVPKSSISPISYRREELENIINTAGKYHGVDPSLSLAVARAESSLRTDAVSKDGHASKGMFQLLDSTAKDLMGRFEVKDSYDPFDPSMNAFLGVGYLRRLHDIFSTETNLGGRLMTSAVKSADDLEKVALAAFNAGEGNVAKAQKLAQRLGKDPASYESIEPYLPPSTRAYVKRVSLDKIEIARAQNASELV